MQLYIDSLRAIRYRFKDIYTWRAFVFIYIRAPLENARHVSFHRLVTVSFDRESRHVGCITASYIGETILNLRLFARIFLRVSVTSNPLCFQ